MINFRQGEKIQLCAVEEEDIGTVLEAPEAADTDLDRYEDFIYLPTSKEKRRTFFEEMAERSGKDDTYFWLVKDLERRYVGSIGTFDCDRRVGVFKYGLRILRPYWRRGYAREAVGIVLRYYFHELRYQKVTVIVYAFNERSQRLHESLGFKLEGRLRRTAYTGGQLHDELYYGLTQEFSELNPEFGPEQAKRP